MSIVTNNFIYGISVQKSYTFMYGITYILFIILIEIKNSIDLHTIPYLIRFLYILYINKKLYEINPFASLWLII